MMITNKLLNIKYATQKKPDQAAQHDLKKYVAITNKNTQKTAVRYDLKLRYGLSVRVKVTHPEPDNSTKRLMCC
jgi:hypothetical protein